MAHHRDYNLKKKCQHCGEEFLSRWYEDFFCTDDCCEAYKAKWAKIRREARWGKDKEE